VIELAKRFVPAADETWRLQRGDDAECRFFQAFADGAHYRGAGGSRQGIYVVTPGGELLASGNVLDPDRVLAMMEETLAAWEALPDDRRRSPREAAFTSGVRWEDSCPEDGLVLASVARDLPPDLDPATEPLRPSNVDHVWISGAELEAWLLPDARGEVAPEGLLERLARFHFVDNVRGQGLPFAAEEVDVVLLRCERSGERFFVHGVTVARAEGPWLLGDNDWRPNREYPRSVETSFRGSWTADAEGRGVSDFELVALGRRTGRAPVNGRREGEEGPIGFLLTIAAPGDRIPPAFVDVYDADWIVVPEAFGRDGR
jgi:hypothetical protein